MILDQTGLYINLASCHTFKSFFSLQVLSNRCWRVNKRRERVTPQVCFLVKYVACMPVHVYIFVPFWTLCHILETNTTKQHLDDLKGELEVYQKALARERADEDAVHVCIKAAIETHIETELKAGMNTDTLKEQMRSLCHKDLVVPSAIQDWVLQAVGTISMKLAPVPGQSQSLVQIPQPEEPTQPLFSKDTLYHASLCCEAVSMHNAANFKIFFQKSAHNLDEVSMSIFEGRENVDQYFIASSQKTKTLYVAFQSQGTLSGWKSMYNSFEEGLLLIISICIDRVYLYSDPHLFCAGLLKQADRIPLRFFIEQLLDKKKIVFTGTTTV